MRTIGACVCLLLFTCIIGSLMNSGPVAGLGLPALFSRDKSLAWAALRRQITEASTLGKERKYVQAGEMFERVRLTASWQRFGDLAARAQWELGVSQLL